MSECVVHMEIPTKDKACGMVFDFDGIWYCPVEQRICHQPDYREIPSWCPIICALPEGHGRLVDASVLKNKNMRKPRGVSSYDYGAMATVFMDIINDTPTIVPAEAKRKVDAHDAVAPTDTPTDTPTVAAERSET